MKKNKYSILTLILLLGLPFLHSCIKPQGGFSEEIVTGPALTEDPGLNVFIIEEAGILQFLQNFEAVANGPDTSYFSRALDPFIAQCNVDGNTVAKFQESSEAGVSNSYQSLFTSIGNPNFFGKKIDFDTNAVSFLGILELNYAAISAPSTAVEKRMIVTVPLTLDGISSSSLEMHLTKLSDGTYLWIGDEGGLAAPNTDCL